MHTELLQMTKKYRLMDNVLQHYIFMYVYIFEVLEAGVFKTFEWFASV